MISPYVGTLFIFLIAHIHGQSTGTRVILMPNDDGHTSVLEVTTGNQTVTIDQPFQVIEVKTASSTPEVKTLSAQAIEQTFPDVLHQTPHEEEKFDLYFQPGDTELTPDSQKTLAAVLEKVKTRPGGELVLIGLGQVGSRESGSLKRALKLKNLIQSKGNVTFQVHAFGRDDSPSLADSMKQAAEPSGGKVEVLLR